MSSDRREFIILIKKNGYLLSSSKNNSKHEIYKNKDGRIIPLPRGNINPMIKKRLIKEYDLRGDK